MPNPKIVLDVAAVEKAAADGLAEYQVAERLGVSADTLTRCKREQPGVADALARGKAAAVGEIENVLYECARLARTDPRYQTSAIFFLKAKGGWTERTVIAVEDADEQRTERSALAERVRALAGGAGFQPATGTA
jgi:transposase